ncbi:MAG: hypothetical protein GY782_11860 [Gammaproteobacteria bacterium]|nr:hypothetical protein [Gammaproteobacteria bacterium]
MSIKLEDGKWYLVNEAVMGDFVAMYSESDSAFISNLYDGEIDEESVLVISEMAPVEQEGSWYEYVKVDCSQLDFWECAREYEAKMHVYWKDVDGKCVIQDLNQLVEQYGVNAIYRRVKVDKRQKFIDEMKEFARSESDIYVILDEAYDKLVK